VCVERIEDGFGSNNFTKVIMVAMFKGGGLTKENLSKKLLCFGVDGMNVLSLMGVHCVAHWTNLAIQSLGDLTLIAHI
jgi:hypothetical protein